MKDKNRGRGRPKEHKEPMHHLHLVMPVALFERVIVVADGRSVSEMVTRLVTKALDAPETT